MSSTLLSLGAAVLGAAVLTTGVFLLISGQRRGRQITGTLSLNHALLGGSFVAAGIAITVAAAHLWPASERGGFDPNSILEQAPTAAAPPPVIDAPGRFADRQWVLLAWGTPSDFGGDSPSEEQAFSRLLADLGKETIDVGLTGAGNTRTRLLSREAVEALRTGAVGLADYCVDNPEAVLVSVEVGDSLAGDDSYVPWREPRYRLFDCRTREQDTASGRVIERRGDQFPYEQALREEFSETLRTWSRTAVNPAARGT